MRVKTGANYSTQIASKLTRLAKNFYDR